MRVWSWLLLVGLAVGAAAAELPSPPEADDIAGRRLRYGLSAWPAGMDEESAGRLVAAAQAVRRRLVALRQAPAASVHAGAWRDEVATVEAHLRHVVWLLRHETELVTGDLERMEVALREAERRAARLEEGAPVPWAEEAGTTVRAFYSRIDGSAQAFGLHVPPGLGSGPGVGLDVVLHGSVRPRGGAALRFAHRYLESRPSVGRPGPSRVIELHPLGRVENGYRWAGETDVFEAIEAACRHFAVDRRRIVLRGFSMGASGTWHIGLKFPDRFAGLAPYCGYVDTYRFSASPNPRFVRVRDLPPHQARLLSIHDAVGYAANAGLLPVVAAMGELDPGFVNHRYMEDAMAAEGLALTNLIAPGTAHVVAPATLRQQLRLLDERIGATGARPPDRVRFVTWTLKYPRAHWIELRRLDRHYERAEVVAERCLDGTLDVAVLRNIAAADFRLDDAPAPIRRVRLAGHELPVSPAAGARLLRLRREGDRWRAKFDPEAAADAGKRPGLQGPIDDAFTDAFLCVLGTDAPWHPAVQAWAEDELRRFASEWERFFGGKLPIKRDVDVTEEDLRTRHLVLFGDPGSNRFIRATVRSLPLVWTRERLILGGEFPAGDHVPRLIAPNPLAKGCGRYVVVNSGHTFGEPELAAVNYLLFPRLGDWAVTEIPTRSLSPPDEFTFATGQRVVAAGLFDEDWRLPPADRAPDSRATSSARP